tara:strand:- start:329 stop:904 length:576 start_codon:yes stop_codon:yes gene_type:complete
MIKVIDDFLPQGFADEIESTLIHYAFPWYYRPSINNGKPKIQDERFKYAHGFVHNFFNEEDGPMSSYYNLIAPLKHFAEQQGIPNKGYHRLKSNLNITIPGWKDGQCQEPHTDMPSPHTVLIYYVNDCDGDTFIFDKQFDSNNPDQIDFTIKERVSPKKNRALVFDGLYYHAGSYPIEHQARVMINCNLIN